MARGPYVVHACSKVSTLSTDGPQIENLWSKCSVLFFSAHVLIGGRDLILRLENADGEVKEGRFRVTKMRCWRIMTLTQSQAKSPEFVSSVFKSNLEPILPNFLLLQRRFFSFFYAV